LAAAGYRVTGVDLDPAMLARAATAWTSVADSDSPGVRTGSLQLVEADLLGLSLPGAGQFRLAFIALNSLLLLGSRTSQRSTLATLVTHLAPDGIAVVDVWQPTAEDLVRYDGRVLLQHVRSDPTSGLLVTKASSAQHDPSSQAVSLTTIYEEAAQGETPRRWIRSDRLRLISADELTGLAVEVGLEIELLAGGYGLEPIGPGTDRAILIARRP
jgi:SAM-dependent methyltransferase